MPTKTPMRAQKMYKIYPMMTSKERLAIWENARRVWGTHRWSAEKELKKMRKEWDRPLSPRK